MKKRDNLEDATLILFHKEEVKKILRKFWIFFSASVSELLLIPGYIEIHHDLAYKE